MKPSRKPWEFIGAGILVGCGLGLIFLAVTGLGDGIWSWLGLGVDTSLGTSAPAVRTNAPDFTLTAMDGRAVQLSDLHGRAVLINFWATWCGPCRLEMPLFQEAYQSNSDDLVVLAINAGEEAGTVSAFVDELGFSYDVLLDPDAEVEDKYRVRAFPTTFLVDQNGVIQVQHIGVMDRVQLNRYLEKVGLSL